MNKSNRFGSNRTIYDGYKRLAAMVILRALQSIQKQINAKLNNQKIVYEKLDVEKKWVLYPKNPWVQYLDLDPDIIEDTINRFYK